MAGKLRIQFPDVFFHVITRRNRVRKRFRDFQHQERYLSFLMASLKKKCKSVLILLRLIPRLSLLGVAECFLLTPDLLCCKFNEIL